MSALASRFGDNNITDVLAHTGFVPHARERGFGLFIIRGAVVPAQLKQFEEDMDTMFEVLAEPLPPPPPSATVKEEPEETVGDEEEESRKRKVRKTSHDHHEVGTTKARILDRDVRLRGHRKKDILYKSVQAVVEERCTCAVGYAGTSKQLLYTVADARCKMLLYSHNWLHYPMTNRQYKFNHIVANVYDSMNQECIPWHSDQHERLGKEAVILSITTHSPGAFCFQPRQGSEFSLKFHEKTTQYTDRRKAYAAEGVRGVLPLNPGDIMVMTGTAQEHLEHKTIANHEITREKLEKYPAVNSDLQDSVDTLLRDVQNGLPRYHAVLTFSKIRHYFNCPCCPAAGLCRATATAAAAGHGVG